jgi:hypothetical protein
VENMSTRRAHTVENLCAKKNFYAVSGCFAVMSVARCFFVIHFACAATVNAYNPAPDLNNLITADPPPR